ncbi:MAG: T9SS type A sorting domain-containing protein [Saprospiraceae bacterium]
MIQDLCMPKDELLILLNSSARLVYCIIFTIEIALLMKFYFLFILFSVCLGLTSQSLVRKNEDFYINSKKLLNPLTGGVNNAQVSEGDINLDGEKDLIIFDREGNVVMPMIYDKNLKNYLFKPEYIKSFPQVKDWMIMKDFNKDGIIDIFSSSSNTQGVDGVEVYQGYINQGKLFFRLTTNGKGNTVIRIVSGSSQYQVYVSPLDLPTISDVDGDGDLDILTYGNGATHVDWYKNIAVERGWSLDSLKYELETNCYGGFREGGFTGDIFLSKFPDSCNDSFLSTKSRHSGSTLLSTDLDANGLSDLLIGDISSNRLVSVFNNGSKTKAWMNLQNPKWQAVTPVNVTVFPCASEVDVDRDGISDILVMPNTRFASANIDNILYYQGLDGTKSKDFEFVKNNFLVDEMLDFGAGMHPCFVDYNQDGLIDLLMGTEGIFITQTNRDSRLILFENQGTATEPEFHLVDSNYLDFKSFSLGGNGVNSFAPCFGDLDGDGDLDMLCGESNGALFFCENIAGPGKKFQFKPALYNYQNISVYANSVPFLVDLNRDGLLDIVCGGRQNNNDANNVLCSSFTYFQNQGTKSKPIFIESSSTLPNTKCLGSAAIETNYKSYSAPFIYDFNGKFKLFSGGLLGRISVFSNIEGNIYGEFKKEETNYGELREGEEVRLSLADIDNDGVLDMAVGNYRGGISLFGTDYKLDGTRLITVKYSNDSISIYPNPFIDHLYIEVKDNEAYSLELYNLSGKMCFHEAKKSSNIVQFPIGLANGVYLIKIKLSNKVYVRKLIKG